MRGWLRLACVVGMFGLFTMGVSAQEDAPAPLLAIAASPRTTPPPTTDDYIAALQMAHEAGARGNSMPYNWSALEPQPNAIDLSQLEQDLNAMAILVPDDTLYLGLQVINTVTREVPSDLVETRFDDPLMRARFRALLEALAPVLSGTPVRYLSIGNEVDVYLNAEDEWAAYTTFFTTAYADAHEILDPLLPGLQVGVTATFNGTRSSLEAVTRLNALSDVYMLTYYPISFDPEMSEPTAPLRDFPLMVEWAGERPVALQEVGYPTSALLDSSEAEQAEFVTHTFEAWAEAGNRIWYLGWFMLHDISQAMCAELGAYYGITDAAFIDFLCTLGLRQADGTPKAAWQVFTEAARNPGGMGE